MKPLLLFAFLLVLAPIGALWVSFCAQIMWTWYVLPVFGVPAPGLWTLAGLSLFWSFTHLSAVPQSDIDEILQRDTATRVLRGVIMVALGPPLILLFGWLYKQFGG